MKKITKNLFLPILAVYFLSSCGDINKEAENKLNELKNKTESLDSLINKEVDKVLALDSLINFESEKVKKLDSLIDKTSSKLDSISMKGSKLLEEYTN
jgi:chromosome segregation ATPase